VDSFNEKNLLDRHRKLLFDLAGAEVLFGFECNGGWASLIDGILCLVGKYGAKHNLNVRVVQVKEKFGLLRIYVHGGDVVIDRILDVAELVSSCTCEICGELGRYYEVNGWLQVRCLRHQLHMSSEATYVLSEDYSMNVAKTISLILWFFGGDYACWLSQECLALGRVRPIEALTSIHGCQAVYDFLRRQEHGVVS